MAQEEGSMSPKTNREVVERYVNGMKARDLDIQAEVCAPDMIVEYPQSGERIRGWANIRAVLENYPTGLPEPVGGKLIGGEDKWVVGPSFNVLRIEGTGDVYSLIGSARYPDDQTWQFVMLIELRSGKIAKTTEIYGAPFDPPPWRSKWVERMA
jgi:SnoaL-like domain